MALFNFKSRSEKTGPVEKTYVSPEIKKPASGAHAPSEEQLRVFRLLESTSDNYFVTGRAGTGKSFLLKYFRENTAKKCVTVAPTGIAAVNVQGVTIHSFFSLDQHAQDPTNSEQLDMSDNSREMLASFQTLIIDEVSMVRSDIMDMIDAKLKTARRSKLPFGGCQIIAFGDLYQLPPFCGDDEIKKYIYDKHYSEFFFAAPVFKNNPMKIIELKEVHRQKDEAFRDILNRIRVGENTADILDKLNARCIEPPAGCDYVTLVPSNEAAQMINKQKLAQLPGKEYVFRGDITGQFSQKEAPTDINLTLKVGAKILMLKNHPQEYWYNGSMGTIEAIEEPDLIRVRLNDPKDPSKQQLYEISRETWQKYQYRYDSKKHSIEQEQIGSFTQFPVRLAYAITIHKSQGQTYDKVKIDYSRNRAFAAGQTYVALSRCTSFDGLFLSKPLLSSDIKVSKEVVRFLQGKKVETSKKETVPAQEKEIQWLPNQCIKAPVIDNPKKVTGTRFAAILDTDSYKTPFSVWCEIMRVYEKPFEENQYTLTGRVIEPKQFAYVSKILKTGFHAVSPDECFGENAKENMGYNFFEEDNEVFGGMWDYILEKNKQRVAVFEMKTTNIKNTAKWQDTIPENAKLQAALYAYLLQVEDFYVVVSFVQTEDYNDPERYVCSKENTRIKTFNLKKDFDDFEKNYIQKVMKWWSQHIETGISPPYDNMRDRDILTELRNL